MRASGRAIASIVVACLAAVPRAHGQAAAAPLDLTVYCVAIVNEDWRFRMITPRKGDYAGVPITKEALQIVNAWDPKADEAANNQCKSYGAPAIMRVPGRLHITWQDQETLRVDIDAGTQTRLFRFSPPSISNSERTWQGISRARWERGGSLTVVTTNVKAGYLRKNGVPYSENATLTEYFDLAPSAAGQLLVATIVVDDPRYLTQPFIVSSHFRKESDGSKWDPTPCSAAW